MSDFSIQTILTFTIAGMGAFLGSYLKKKGENLATQEDIKKMTEKVEEIKNKFNLQTEEFKAQLSLISQTKSKYLQEKRDVYLNLFSKLTYWYRLCIDFDLETIHYPDENIIHGVKQKFAQAKFDASYYNDILLVYNDDEEYIDIVGKFFMFVLKMQHFIAGILEGVLYTELDYKNSKITSEECQKMKSGYFGEFRKTMTENSRAIFTLRNLLVVKTNQILKTLAEK